LSKWLAKKFIEVLRKTFQQKVSSTAEFVELVGADVSNKAKKKLNRLLSSLKIGCQLRMG